jgi:hypothetical protein
MESLPKLIMLAVGLVFMLTATAPADAANKAANTAGMSRKPRRRRIPATAVPTVFVRGRSTMVPIIWATIPTRIFASRFCAISAPATAATTKPTI